MELDELKTVWKQQQEDPDMEYSQSELLMLLNNKMLSFEKDIYSRDRRELIACAVVMIIFALWLFTAPSVWTQIGCGIITAGCAFIAWKLNSARPEGRGEPLQANHSLTAHLQLELQKVLVQKKLLRSVAGWYIAPISAGLLFITIGFDMALVFKVIYLTVVAGMGFGIWWMNQKAVRKRLDPLIDEIRDSLAFLETKGDDPA